MINSTQGDNGSGKKSRIPGQKQPSTSENDNNSSDKKQ